jgi:hypothetical protein
MPLLSGLLLIGHNDAACAAFPLVRVVVRGGVEPSTFRFSGLRTTVYDGACDYIRLLTGVLNCRATRMDLHE